ncbi:MAG: hypothetical protein MUW56_13175 [Chryseobacterium sp.]|uniref:hypothetical protein n=1 Tax=Chryseobacterium sp. TaxID=1871047 RepID=UPI0025BA2D6A|nr:hypothetical protein [Chryseobacterium sp.]MCJ7934546.1 hypothetical protein [Chryseobacterium sp.]
MKNNLIFIVTILFFSLSDAQNRVYSLYDGKELNKLFINKEQVKYSNEGTTIVYTLEKQNSESLKINNDHFSFSILFDKENTIKILPFNLQIKTNSELYKYLKNSVLNKSEIQKIGLLFYPINRFYDDCCLYFNQDIFIKDWDQDMYSSKFKIFSIEQLDGKKILLKGTYHYKGDTVDKINYYRDEDGNLFEFYSEHLTNKSNKYKQYSFKYYAPNEKYILDGFHYRDKNNRVMKAVYKNENMSDTSKTKTQTFNYPYLKVQIKDN